VRGNTKHRKGPHRNAKDLQKDRKGPVMTAKDHTGPLIDCKGPHMTTKTAKYLKETRKVLHRTSR